jgi:hypothetical protein
MAARVYCPDANVPYRLMKTDVLTQIIERVPRSFVLSNVALAVLLAREGVRTLTVPIRFRKRYGGTSSIRLGDFLGKAVGLVRQLQHLA